MNAQELIAALKDLQQTRDADLVVERLQALIDRLKAESDLDRLAELLASFGLERHDEEFEWSCLGDFAVGTRDQQRELVLGEGHGYCGFRAHFEFDQDGRFLRHAVVE